MDSFQIFLSILMAAIFSFGVGVIVGESVRENYYQKLLIEKYDATYCDGKFSLEKCDD